MKKGSTRGRGQRDQSTLGSNVPGKSPVLATGDTYELRAQKKGAG